MKVVLAGNLSRLSEISLEVVRLSREPLMDYALKLVFEAFDEG